MFSHELTQMITNEITNQNLFSNGILKGSATIISPFFSMLFYIVENFGFSKIDFIRVH